MFFSCHSHGSKPRRNKPNLRVPENVDPGLIRPCLLWGCPGFGGDLSLLEGNNPILISGFINPGSTQLGSSLLTRQTHLILVGVGGAEGASQGPLRGEAGGVGPLWARLTGVAVLPQHSEGVLVFCPGNEEKKRNRRLRGARNLARGSE